MTMRFKYFVMIFAAIAIVAGCANEQPGNAKLEDGDWSNKLMSWSKMPEMAIDLNHDYTAAFHTSKGDFVIKLFADEAPLTVNNFVFLANEGYYNGTTFHRVVESYMIVGGDRESKGVRSPGYVIPDELNTGMKYEEGIIAMGNSGTPNSGGGQFFICTGPDAANLNKEPTYSIFGRVISGMDVVKAIAGAPVKDNVPVEPIVIESIVIHEL